MMFGSIFEGIYGVNVHFGGVHRIKDELLFDFTVYCEEFCTHTV